MFIDQENFSAIIETDGRLTLWLLLWRCAFWKQSQFGDVKRLSYHLER